MTPLFDDDVPEESATVSAPNDTAISVPKRKGRPRGSTNRPKRGTVSKEAQETVHQFGVAISGIVFAMLSLDPELCPTEHELNSILIPMERLLLRRTSVTDKLSEDAMDIMSLTVGVAIYGIRAIQVILARRRVANATKGQRTQSPTADSGQHNGSFNPPNLTNLYKSITDDIA